MSDLMKDRYYNYNTIDELAMCVNAVYPTFPADDFIAGVMDETWDTLELKARMRRITINLGKYLPPDYGQALGILDRMSAIGIYQWLRWNGIRGIQRLNLL